MAQTHEERLRRVRVLLASLYDYLPGPAPSALGRASVPGPAPGRRVPCGLCSRSGHVLQQGRRRLCPACEGSGWRPRRGPRDLPTHPDYEEPYDEYTGERVSAAEARRPPSLTLRQLDHEIAKLERDAELRAGDVRSEAFGWERERRSQDRQGSYPELRRALLLLATRWPQGYRQIERCYLRNVQVQLTLDDWSALDAAEEWLAREMRGEIRVPAWFEERTAKRKERSVAELAAEGMSAGQIARQLRLAKRTVQKLLRAR